MQKLTKSEAKVLKALDDAQDKVLPYYTLRLAAGLSMRGFRTVLARMEEKNLIANAGGGRETITFGGIRALKSVRA